MTNTEQKVKQYLSEALVLEEGLTRVLQSQIAMTPRGSYRTTLERHLKQTKGHARRVRSRRDELGGGGRDLLRAGLGVAQEIAGQTVALSMVPYELLRGSGGEEKILKNALDGCAAEAREIATYSAIERLAQDVDDRETAKLAASIRREEEQALAAITAELPALTDAMVRAELRDDPSFDVSKIGAADAARRASRSARGAAGRGASTAKRRGAREARKVPGVAQLEGEARGAVATEGDLPIAGYDELTVEEIVGRLPSLSQVQLAILAAYERRHEDRSTVLDRLGRLRTREPWPGYDELNVQEIRAVLSEHPGGERARAVREYERAHKDRAGVLDTAEHELARR
ncbi:MAG TPA: DUF892 family protein [Solirubrobacteraceae bacterium]|nr:DUF892 family protein [Solirubrobacteraceae bacterium]